MKKLNRKGFTLIELLAVIVVLAIVLVVTIPSVISSMENAKKEQFENAVTTIQKYLTKQQEMCMMQGSGLIDEANYKGELFGNDCKFKTMPTDTTDANYNGKLVITGAGYTIDKYKADGTTIDLYGDFASVTYNENGELTAATSSSGSQFGEYNWNSTTKKATKPTT